MFLLPGGSAEQYSYHKDESTSDDALDEEAIGVKPEITMMG
jgi:hypothetical protein